MKLYPVAHERRSGMTTHELKLDFITSAEKARKRRVALEKEELSTTDVRNPILLPFMEVPLNMTGFLLFAKWLGDAYSEGFMWVIEQAERAETEGWFHD